jgi:DNA-binding transcriptional ArsR family regulator
MMEKNTMSDEFQPVELMTISDLETLKVMTDPLRLQILEIFMEQPTTVKQLAARLEMEPTKLYYHVNLLEKHELIAVVKTQVVSGIIEKHYMAAAGTFHVDRNLLSSDSGGDSAMAIIDTILGPVTGEIRDGIRKGMISTSEDAQPRNKLMLRRAKFTLQDDDAEAFYEKITALINDYAGKDKTNQMTPDKQAYSLTIAMYPVEVGLSGETEEASNE